MGCFLRADQLLLPVRSSYLERHIQNHLQEEGGSRGTWMPKGNRHLCCQWKPEVLSCSAMLGMSCLEHFLTLTAREVGGNSTNAFP